MAVPPTEDPSFFFQVFHPDRGNPRVQLFRNHNRLTGPNALSASQSVAGAPIAGGGTLRPGNSRNSSSMHPPYQALSAAPREDHSGQLQTGGCDGRNSLISELVGG